MRGMTRPNATDVEGVPGSTTMGQGPIYFMTARICCSAVTVSDNSTGVFRDSDKNF